MQAPSKNSLLIHNPRAGNGGYARRRTIDEARGILASRGIETDLAETRKPGEAVEIARAAAKAGCDLVIVCGGDGTLNEVVNGLASSPGGCQVPLALLPGGTANILAKELGLPLDVLRAASHLPRATPRSVALGLATPLASPAKRRYFLCVAGAGPDGIMVYSVDLALKEKVGVLAYCYEGLRQLLRYTFPHFRITSAERTVDASLIVVGRTKHYGGPFQITTEADLFEDSFELAAVTAESGWGYLGHLPALWLNRLRETSGIHFWKTDSLVCEPLRTEPVYAQVDGEPLGRLPVEFHIVPGAITLMVPQPPPKNAASGRNGRRTERTIESQLEHAARG
jgi:YegS/Rv2252/BmrU family lipid kinase